MTTWQKLTDEEEAVLNLLGEAWSKFRQLPEQHPTHNAEMMYAIHQAQRLILARVGSRSLGYLPADASKMKGTSIMDQTYSIRPEDPMHEFGTPSYFLQIVANKVSQRIGVPWKSGDRIYSPDYEDMCAVSFRGHDSLTHRNWSSGFVVRISEIQETLASSSGTVDIALEGLINRLAEQVLSDPLYRDPPSE